MNNRKEPVKNAADQEHSALMADGVSDVMLASLLDKEQQVMLSLSSTAAEEGGNANR